MIDFHGLVLAFTLATCADRSICVPSDKCMGPILPAWGCCGRWDRASSRGTYHAGVGIAQGRSRQEISGLPTGRRILPPMPAETPAAEVYQATSAVTMPR